MTTEEQSNPESNYRLPIRRPVTTAMIFLTIVVFGLKSYQGLPLNLMPDISYPTLTVRTEYEGGAPEDIEKLVTRPLEETLSLVSGMVEISSTSSPGLSEIVLEFTWDTDMNVAQQEVRDQLDLFDPPQEVTEKPIILRYDPTLDPVLRVAITGPDLSDDIADPVERNRRYNQYLGEIREAAERHIKSDLEGEVGIAQVNIKGGVEKEIEVLVDSIRLKNQGLSLQSVANALAQQNINLSGGSLKEGKTEFLVRTLNEYQDVEEIGDTIIAAPDGHQIRLNDVARVFVGEKDRETIVRINGREAVELEIFKDGDANTVEVCRKLKRLLGFEVPPRVLDQLIRAAQQQQMTEEEVREVELARTMRDRLPEDVELTIISDQSRFIVSSINEVQSTALVGGLLALLILYFFLRDLRSTLIIGVSIPISVIATFVPMFMRDISLNIMSLGGLALGIGMLVDNSIVVLESIFRCREEGDDLVSAANRGTNEVGSAVTASTLTTVAVFLPIAFVEGVAGQLFSDQAMTVTFSLMASLLVALYLIPMIASRSRMLFAKGESAVWLLRAYRHARHEEGRGRVASLVRIVPLSASYAKQWLGDTRRNTYEPVARYWRGNPEDPAFVRALKLSMTPLLFVLLTAIFIALLVLKTVSAILIAYIFCLLGFIVAAVGLVLFALKYVLWFPLLAFDKGFAFIRYSYEKVLRATLQFGPILVFLVVLVSWHAATLATSLGQELIPPLKQGEFGIRMQAPPGTRLDETARQASRLEQIILDYPYVDSVAVQVGQEKDKASGQRGENVADFTVILENPNETAQLQDQIIAELRPVIQAVTPNDVTFTLPKLFSFKAAVELQIRGDDIGELRELGRQALLLVEDTPGLRDPDLSMKEGYPEVIIELDRELLAAKNLSADDVAQRLRREVQGDIATRFNEAGFKVDVRVRTDRQRLQSVDDLRMLSVVDGTPPIPLKDVAYIDEQEGPSEIRRIDQRQVAVITGNVEGRDLAAVTAEMINRLDALDMPDDYEIVAGGQNRELETSYRSLIFALSLAVFLVYVVMACQFESVLHPALVMSSVPLAGIGVVYALEWTRTDVSIIVFIGAITLAGIVVNNAIVLVDYINQLRARGLPKREAVVQAGQVRLRPILMTTLTTVLGLVPMAVYAGEGAEIRRPMAITIMAGLMSSTILTLIILPTVYDLFGGRDKPHEDTVTT